MLLEQFYIVYVIDNNNHLTKLIMTLHNKNRLVVLCIIIAINNHLRASIPHTFSFTNLCIIVIIIIHHLRASVCHAYRLTNILIYTIICIATPRLTPCIRGIDNLYKWALPHLAARPFAEVASAKHRGSATQKVNCPGSSWAF